mgnify:CR=1 FL=1
MLTPAERDALKRDYPSHIFCRVVRGGWSVLLAIPKRTDDPPVKSLNDTPLSMLHGATMKIGGNS